MSRDLSINRCAGLAALALLLAVAPACNQNDDPGQAENVVLVTGIATAGLSAAAPEPTTATLDYTLNPRTVGAITFYNDVTLTSYSVTFNPAVLAPVSGAISTGYCQAGASCAVTLTLVPVGIVKPAGMVVIATADIEGKDTNDNPVNFQATIPLEFIP